MSVGSATLVVKARGEATMDMDGPAFGLERHRWGQSIHAAGA